MSTGMLLDVGVGNKYPIIETEWGSFRKCDKHGYFALLFETCPTCRRAAERRERWTKQALCRQVAEARSQTWRRGRRRGSWVNSKPERRVAKMTAVMLRLDGFSYGEIGDFMGCSRQTTRIRIHSDAALAVGRILYEIRESACG